MISKLLVANRGEIALRVMRTCRELGIATVAVHADPDAGAPFVRFADEAVSLGGSTPAESYLRGDAVVAAAVAAGADAVHPGYGFLSENAGFARAVGDAGLVWVGPPPAAIEAMGSKLAARSLMADAGVPVLPGEDLTGVDDADLEAVADRVGWPVLVKASAGGGGRGMRIVRSPADLVDAVAGARREAASAFGDGTVFLEHYVDEPRHVEIQILGDAHGNLVHLFERECSIQRRHQKLIEESPSPVVTEVRRKAMGEAAVTAGVAIGYVGAGTVEFVFTPDGDFYFLEVNTRLQVEHPVTEAITGLDLVALQLAVAEGATLPPAATSATISGHAIEARLCAEDAAADFLPAAGTLARIELDSVPGIRVDSGVVSGDEVSINYDSMLAKVVAHGPTREAAVRKLAAALRRARIHGVVTNRELLVGVLEHPEFAAGQIDTHFLNRHAPADLVAAGGPGPDHRLAAVAAALAEQARHRAAARTWAEAPSGWRNLRSAPQRATYRDGEATIEVAYVLGGSEAAPGEISVDGTVLDVAVVAAGPDLVELDTDGVRRRFLVDVAPQGSPGEGEQATEVWVDTDRGGIHLVRQPRFPPPEAALAAGSLLAPMPGTVISVSVDVGDTVTTGQRLLVLEAMKMEHVIAAATDGVVTELPVAAGDTVAQGSVLVAVEAPEDGDG